MTEVIQDEMKSNLSGLNKRRPLDKFEFKLAINERNMIALNCDILSIMFLLIYFLFHG